MEKLEFLSTVSAEEFKEEQGVSKLDILKNETSGKCFFAWGSHRGAVTSKYPKETLSEPMVSEVMDSEGKTFYLLHNKGESKASKVESI